MGRFCWRGVLLKITYVAGGFCAAANAQQLVRATPWSSEPMTRFGAIMSFTALGVLLVVTLASLAFAWRQRMVRKAKDRERWGLLLSKYQRPKQADDNFMQTAAEPLLPASQSEYICL